MNILFVNNKEELRKFRVVDLKQFLRESKERVSGRKDVLIERVWNILKKKQIDTYVLKIQAYYKRYFLRKIFKLRGDIVNCYKSVNDTDFATFEPISTISHKYKFSFRYNNLLYAFDIRSIHKLLETSKINPYNMCEIPEHIIKNVNIIYSFVTRHCKKTNIKNEQSIKQYALEVFHKFNLLDNYTDIDWFLNLTLKQLKILYYEAFDIWNYRANLANEDKNKIIPFEKAFKSMYIINYSNDFEFVQREILKEFDNFVSLGQTRDDRVVGSMWMLTALTIVSPSCAVALPHLVQVF